MPYSYHNKVMHIHEINILGSGTTASTITCAMITAKGAYYLNWTRESTNTLCARVCRCVYVGVPVCMFVYVRIRVCTPVHMCTLGLGVCVCARVLTHICYRHVHKKNMNETKNFGAYTYYNKKQLKMYVCIMINAEIQLLLYPRFNKILIKNGQLQYTLKTAVMAHFEELIYLQMCVYVCVVNELCVNFLRVRVFTDINVCESVCALVQACIRVHM